MKHIIEYLYVHENLDLPTVMELMKKRHKFYATYVSPKLRWTWPTATQR